LKDDHQCKTTSIGIREPKRKRPPMEDDHQWKMTSNGRRHPMEDALQWKMTSNGGRPQMEDDPPKKLILKAFMKKTLKLAGLNWGQP
jgi:hypothetical protein